MEKTQTMTLGTVAAGHPITAQAASDVLTAGGNAFDAVLAAMLASCVAEPVLASLGGGGFLMAHAQDAEPQVFDFFVQTPRQRRPLEEIEFRPILADFGTTQQEFHIGMGTIATPGVVAGMAAIHEALCTLPLEALVAPAVDAARQGVRVNSFQHYIATIVSPILTATPEAFALHASIGENVRLAGEGETLRNAPLADTLEALAFEGPDLFYLGEIGARIAHDCQAHGGWLTRDDFSSYRVARRRPLACRYHGHRVYLNPPPSVGGTLLAFTLGMLDRMPSFFGSAEGTHLAGAGRAMAMTQAARRHHRVDFGLDGQLAGVLLDAATLEEYATALDGTLSTRGTTHISVADRQGNLASLTLSNGEGSSYVARDTGIMLNNMLGEEDLNASGFHQWPVDSRVASMMAPSLAHASDGTWYALGSGGSNRIRSAVLQTLINLLDARMSIDDAVRMPRIHVENDQINIEAGLPEALVDELVAHFPDHRLWPDINLFFGGAHSVLRRADGGLAGAGDPRRGGVCLTV